MANALAALLTWLAGALTSQVAIGVAQWVAWRAFILFVVLTIFPIMFTNFIYHMVSTLFDIIGSYIGGAGLHSSTIGLTGLAGCLANYLRLPECMALYLSAAMFRIGLQMIPGVGLGR